MPEVYEPDCYKDVDESDYACKEKYRIMVSIVDRGQFQWEIITMSWFGFD